MRLQSIFLALVCMISSFTLASAQSADPGPFDFAHCFPPDFPLITLSDDPKIADEQTAYIFNQPSRQAWHYAREGCGDFYLNVKNYQEESGRLITYESRTWSLDDAKQIVTNFLPAGTKISDWTLREMKDGDDMQYGATCLNSSFPCVIYMRQPIDGQGNSWIRIAKSVEDLLSPCYDDECPFEGS